MQNFPERVAARAADIQVVKVLLTVLALPFYLLGLLAGLAWVALRWFFAAVVVGFGDVTSRQAVVSDDAG